MPSRWASAPWCTVMSWATWSAEAQTPAVLALIRLLTRTPQGPVTEPADTTVPDHEEPDEVGEAEAVAVLTDLEQIARSVHVVVDTDGSVVVRGSRSGAHPSKRANPHARWRLRLATSGANWR